MYQFGLFSALFLCDQCRKYLFYPFSHYHTFFTPFNTLFFAYPIYPFFRAMAKFDGEDQRWWETPMVLPSIAKRAMAVN